MGSVIDYTSCPQCGGEYYNDWNYRTGEEYRFCCRCGKTESWSIKRDSEGEACFDENQKLCYIEESHFGFGVAKFARANGIGTLMCASEPVDQELISDFLKTLETEPDLDKSQCYLTAWDAEKREVIAIYGKVPPLYEEEAESEADQVPLGEPAASD